MTTESQGGVSEAVCSECGKGLKKVECQHGFYGTLQGDPEVLTATCDDCWTRAMNQPPAPTQEPVAWGAMDSSGTVVLAEVNVHVARGRCEDFNRSFRPAELVPLYASPVLAQKRETDWRAGARAFAARMAGEEPERMTLAQLREIAMRQGDGGPDSAVWTQIYNALTARMGASEPTEGERG